VRASRVTSSRATRTRRNFAPAEKPYPAFAVAELGELRRALTARGVAVIGDDAIPGTRRFYAEDSWGNRLEFVESRQ